MKWFVIALAVSSAAIAANASYPQTVRLAFLGKCTGLSKELSAPCQCILNGLEKHMEYKEFQTIIQKPNPMQDRTIKAISQQCAFKASGQQQ